MIDLSNIDGQTWGIICTICAAVGSGLWKFASWVRGNGRSFIEWAKPQIEGVVNEHRELVATLRTTQTGLVTDVGHIKQTVTGHTEQLTRIEGKVCRATTPPKDSTT